MGELCEEGRGGGVRAKKRSTCEQDEGSEVKLERGRRRAAMDFGFYGWRSCHNEVELALASWETQRRCVRRQILVAMALVASAKLAGGRSKRQQRKSP